MSRWARILDLAAVVNHRREEVAEVLGPRRVFVDDQELASAREHLLSVGLDLTSRDEVCAAIVGAEVVVQMARATEAVGMAQPGHVLIVDHFAELAVRQLAQLLPTEAHR